MYGKCSDTEVADNILTYSVVKDVFKDIYLWEKMKAVSICLRTSVILYYCFLKDLDTAATIMVHLHVYQS